VSNSIFNKFKDFIPSLSSNKDFLFFFLAICFFGFSQSAYDSTFNNFLNESFTISNFQRGFLELPREMPGFLVIFVSALFFFLCPRRLAALANLILALGLILIAFFSSTFNIMLIWLFIFSIGQHIFLPLKSSIGMELAKEGNTGSVLGKITGVQNFAAIIGSFAIFLGFKYLNLNFKFTFLFGAFGFLITGFFVSLMSKGNAISVKEKFVLRKKYTLFYWLNILYGTRKQLFLTFAPWVLVTIYNQKTQVIAILLTISGVIGIFFKPMLGKLIDKLGERIILVGEAIVLILVCLSYGFCKFIFEYKIALYITCVCYMLDYLLMSVSMARATYLQKIALDPNDVHQTLTMGVSIDHIFSISIALLSGFLWLKLGFQYVFLLGALIAFINMISASFIKIKKAN
jgi:predicted MFS family arabinose efflux permease